MSNLRTKRLVVPVLICILFFSSFSCTVRHEKKQETSTYLEEAIHKIVSNYKEFDSWSFYSTNGSREVDSVANIVTLGFVPGSDSKNMNKAVDELYDALIPLGFSDVQCRAVYRWQETISVIPENGKEVGYSYDVVLAKLLDDLQKEYYQDKLRILYYVKEALVPAQILVYFCMQNDPTIEFMQKLRQLFESSILEVSRS